MVRYTVGLLTLFLLAGSAAAQTQPRKVMVGDGTVDGKHFKPYKNQWRVSVSTPAGKHDPDAALWTDQLESVYLNGCQCLQRTQVATFHKDGQDVGRTTTINVFDPETMAPVSRSFTRQAVKTGADDSTKIQFRGSELHSVHTTEGKSESRDVQLETPAFDFYGGLYGLLLAAMPLKTGFSASIPSVDEDSPTVSWLSFKVVAQQSIDAGSMGKVSAWVVEADSSLGPMKFWLSKDAPYILRLEYVAKDNGFFWKYEMV